MKRRAFLTTLAAAAAAPLLPRAPVSPYAPYVAASTGPLDVSWFIGRNQGPPPGVEYFSAMQLLVEPPPVGARG
jgi:hypothetical protein